MIRDLRRLYRRHGIRPFALPCIVVLGLAVLFDRHVGTYAEHRDDLAQARAERELIEARLERKERIEVGHAERKSRADALLARALAGKDAAEAQSALQSAVSALLGSIYAAPAEFHPVEPLPTGDSGVVALDVVFSAVPQQLPRFEQALAMADKELRLSAIELTVRPAPRGGDELLVRARVAGLFHASVADARKPSAAQGAPGARPGIQ